MLSDGLMHHIRLLQELMTRAAAQACKPGSLLCLADPGCCWGGGELLSHPLGSLQGANAFAAGLEESMAQGTGTDLEHGWGSRRRQLLRRAKGPVIPSSADQAGHTQLSIAWHWVKCSCRRRRRRVQAVSTAGCSCRRHADLEQIFGAAKLTRC